MRVSLGLLVAALTLLLPAAAAGAADSGVKVRVVDVSCLGPCSPTASPPRTYGGEATIVVKRSASGRRVASEEVDDGRVREGLRPGDYRVRVKIEDPCWSEDAKPVTVTPGDFVRVVLEVGNTCIR
jgi:hypothetical protein